tara:strand:- start:27017 stop:28612 length:1596 start_codon:yes stop_codon:yes gene_type:complete
MSKLNRKEFKDLLIEWNHSLNNDLLLEISRNEVIDIIGQDDYNTLVKLNRKASQDQNFLQIIINTYNSNQNHTIEDILGLYQNYTRFIASKWNQGDTADIDVPGGLRASLTPDSTTYDDMLKFIDAASSMILKSKAYINCLKQGPVNTDFEVIINDSDWIICYPKTIKGSISLARSFWNGSELEYDKSVSGGEGRMIGKMNWCTSIVSGGNMFLNYHRKMNLHIYYCIKKNMSVSDPDRKLCISFSKKYNKVKFNEGHSSVDGNNKITSEKEFRSYIGDKFDVLFRDAENPERLEIDEKAYYESISLEQYKTLRAANEDNLEDFFRELEGILTYSRDRIKIFKLSLAQDGSNESFKRLVVKRKDLLQADPTGEIIKQLATDEDINVRVAVARREDLLEADPTGKIIKQLAQDKNKWVREKIAYHKDLLEADPTGEIIKQLAQDEDGDVRVAVARREDLLEADPSGNLIKQLVTDKDKWVRQQIDPTGELIKQLAQDENEYIRAEIAKRYDLSKLSSSTNESLLRSYIKYLL